MVALLTIWKSQEREVWKPYDFKPSPPYRVAALALGEIGWNAQFLEARM